MSSLCEVVLYSGEFFVWGGHVFWRVFFCVGWSSILASSLCKVVMYSSEMFVCGGQCFLGT